MRLTLYLTLGLAFAAAPLSAQDKAEEKKAPPTMASMMNKPGPEAAKLKSLVGTWNVEETVEESPMGPAGKGHAVNHVTLGPGGMSIIIDYRSTRGHMKGYRALGVLAWDGEAKAYKQAWTDNMMPMLGISTGAWEGDKLIMNSEGTMMGKPFKGRDTLTGIGTDTFTLTSEMSMDGSPMAKMMTLAHKRAKAPEAKPAEKKEPAPK